MITTVLSPIRKITISLPSELVAFTDSMAQQNQTSCSQFIGNRLSQFKVEEEERLAIEGYTFYAEEAAEFATRTATTTTEAFAHIT